MEREYSCRIFYPEILSSIVEHLTDKYEGSTFKYTVSNTYKMAEYHNHYVTIERFIPTQRKPIFQKMVQLYFFSNRVEFYFKTEDTFETFVIPMKKYNIVVLERLFYEYFL